MTWVPETDTEGLGKAGASTANTTTEATMARHVPGAIVSRKV